MCLLTAVNEAKIEKPTSGPPGGVHKRWQAIASIIKKKTGIELDPSVCKSKFQYLKKEYKTWIDSQKGTGAERKDPPRFAAELEKIFEKDHAVQPRVLLQPQGFLEQPNLSSSK